MEVIKYLNSATFYGEDGDRLGARAQGSAGRLQSLELSLECDDNFIATALSKSEACELKDFLSVVSGKSSVSSIAFPGADGERLVFSHTNRGEPFREGIDVRLEGVKEFPDYLGPFIEDCEIRNVVTFLTKIL